MQIHASFEIPFSVCGLTRREEIAPVSFSLVAIIEFEMALLHCGLEIEEGTIKRKLGLIFLYSKVT